MNISDYNIHLNNLFLMFNKAEINCPYCNAVLFYHKNNDYYYAHYDCENKRCFSIVSNNNRLSFNFKNTLYYTCQIKTGQEDYWIRTLPDIQIGNPGIVCPITPNLSDLNKTIQQIESYFKVCDFYS